LHIYYTNGNSFAFLLILTCGYLSLQFAKVLRVQSGGGGGGQIELV